MHEYKRHLERLIKFDGSVSELQAVIDRLSRLRWDEDDEDLIVSYRDVVHVLNRYISNELSVVDVYFWADALEFRDGISFSHEEDKYVFQSMFALANPELEGELTPERARRLLTVLQSASPTEEQIHDAYR